MPATDAPSNDGLPVVDDNTTESERVVKPNPSNVNVVRPLARPTVDTRTALDPKFSRALDFKLRRLKEKEVLEANLRRPVRPRLGMGALAASECNLSHLNQDRTQREKKNRSHPHINCISSMEKTKISPRAENTPSPDQKKRNKQNDSDKPRFVTTVKTGQFLLPPPEVAYLLGLHTLYPSQEKEKVVYSYASKPKAVATRSKRSVVEAKENRIPNGGPNVDAGRKGINPGEAFRGVRALIASVAGMRHIAEKQDKIEEAGPRNLMHDRRVVRGSTFAPQTAHAHAAGDGASKSRRRALARRAALARLRPGTPPPAPGRRHLPVQTEHYLQELFDKGVELEVGVQTDLFVDRPATPIYVPAKTGADAHTQIYPGDLFDFDLEVQPILETLVGKTAEQALAEVAQEEELATLREQQRRYLELRDAERAERQRLLAQDIRLQAEKERRVGEARAAQIAASEARARAAAAALVQGYVAELLPSVLAGLRSHGYLIERIQTGVNEEVMPWLIQEVSLEIESIITSRDVLTEIVRDVVEARAQAPTPLYAPETPTPPSTPSSMMLEVSQTQEKDEREKKPQSVRDLFNTKSCIPGPFRCPHPQMQFFLYTRSTQEKGELLNTLDNNSLTNSKFNPKYPTKIVVHGFGGGRNLSPSTDMRNAYFARGNYNIIIVDYGSLVKEPCLSQIEWAPRFASMCIAQLVDYLQYHPKKSVAPERIHTIGYSVGAHILGLVANHLNDGKLGRITGLDPTIFFYMGNNRSRDLDHTDALFVDIVHTGAGILGQWGPNGHADFYVNGGSSQPGCAHDTIFQTLSCDHTKVTPYFIESINSPTGFWAGPCPNLFSYLIGWCEPKDTEYVLMGEHVTHKARGVYYVTTNANPPYARGFPGKTRRLRSVTPYS